MKLTFRSYEDKDAISLQWDNPFEESVIEETFGKEGGVLARRFANCIHLEKMDEELEKIIDKYFKKKYKGKE